MIKNFTSVSLSSGLKNMFSRYSKALIEKPYKTKIITAGIIFVKKSSFTLHLGVLTVVGDCICQSVIEKKTFRETYNYQRTLNLLLIGTMISTPFCHIWYAKGAPAICKAVSNNQKLYPFISMAVDQTLITATMLGTFLFLTEYMKDFSVKEGVHNVRRKFKTAIVTNWKVWPPIILANFLLVPPHLRVLFVNTIGFFWGIYMSYFQYNT